MKKIMIIEDDITMRQLLSTLLNMEGYIILSCDINSEKEILNSLTDQNPDGVLIDIHLHGINGLNLLKQLRSNLFIKQPKVLMTSGMDMAIESQESGADGFLLKPYMPDDLIQALRKFFQQ
jgi:CheY-like chemotaxis protein